MTSSVISALNKIKELEVFKDELYFTGVTTVNGNYCTAGIKK